MAQVTGFQDYARLSVQSGASLAVLNSAVGGAPQTGYLDTAGYGYVNIAIQTGTLSGLFAVLMFWSTDQTSFTSVGDETFAVRTGTGTIKQYPVQGRWLNVVLQDLGGAATDVPFIEIFGTNAMVPAYSTHGHRGPLISVNTSVAASATLTQEADRTYEGPATICIAQDANNKWFGTAEWYTGAAWQRFLFVFGSSAGQGFTSRINLPPAPVRLNITNQDTVSHGCYLELVGG